MLTLRNSLSYEPIELNFGTSGLRGLVADMTDLECYINISAFLSYLKDSKSLIKGSPIYIGGDLRDSTPRIMTVATKAIEDSGCRAVNCGLIPTPALAFYAQENSTPCIMVTGSHIPADRNGIKFYKASGEVLKDDEEPIKHHVTRKRQKLYGSDIDSSEFNSKGELINRPPLPAVESEAERIFTERYTNFSDSPLAGKHIVVYQHSAVGRDLLCTILKSLGAKVTPVGRSDTFVSIDTENVTPENEAYFKELAEQYPDNFAVVSTDGDSDRPFVIDEAGRFYRGDVVGCVVAKEVGASFAAIPVSSNDAVDLFCKTEGIEYLHTKIGSPFVIQAMQAARSSIVVGWEVNGGFLLETDVMLMGQKLKRLPTRDAILPILTVLLRAAKKGITVSAIFELLPKRYTGGGLIDNVGQVAIEHLRHLHNDEQKVKKLVQGEIKEKSLGEPTDINLQDGVRVRFSSNDIVHIRPSGNAPQLRVYTTSDSQVRASDLALRAVRAGGFLERFIKAMDNYYG